MPFPLSGQGKELPSDLPYKGWWILEPRLFLFKTAETRRDSAAPQFTAYINYARDDWMVGFDAIQLAAAIGITVDQLLEANRSQQLTLERVEIGTTSDGATAKQYTFRVGHHEGSVFIASPVHMGSA